MSCNENGLRNIVSCLAASLFPSPLSLLLLSQLQRRGSVLPLLQGVGFNIWYQSLVEAISRKRGEEGGAGFGSAKAGGAFGGKLDGICSSDVAAEKSARKLEVASAAAYCRDRKHACEFLIPVRRSKVFPNGGLQLVRPEVETDWDPPAGRS
ncbi:hypothetical protein KFK09_018081 [Dendrobium nobile]|uniref:Uncharacterized protein n=1 Tax=Dendrobium nobile TaxID=94219 RepID=A0A8T3ATU0_DENNO|nr:hypothetical protein KFK09_018081 [Dendrobium nobile]